MDHFGDLSASQASELEQLKEAGRPFFSLANVLRLHRPMVIVDEAHNARTPLSFDTLARFSPSLILELTATPQTEHNPSRDQHASNILHAVSAAELKAGRDDQAANQADHRSGLAKDESAWRAIVAQRLRKRQRRRRRRPETMCDR